MQMMHISKDKSIAMEGRIDRNRRRNRSQSKDKSIAIKGHNLMQPNYDLMQSKGKVIAIEEQFDVTNMAAIAADVLQSLHSLPALNVEEGERSVVATKP
jgi:hypothetical protein